jgi:hypothetical protein
VAEVSFRELVSDKDLHKRDSPNVT